jgi:uncharacterized protein YidB (DUF937 family)
MGLLDSVIGALGSQGGAGGGGNTQAALLQAVLGMLMQGGQGGGGQSAGGGLGGLLGGLGQMAGGGSGGGGMGGMGGLGGLLEQFSRAGLGEAAQSWVSTGPNQPVSGDQISQVLGGDMIGNLARQLGMDPSAVSGQLSQMLPEVVDRLTPNGQLPQGNDLASLGNIDAVLGSLLRR